MQPITVPTNTPIDQLGHVVRGITIGNLSTGDIATTSDGSESIQGYNIFILTNYLRDTFGDHVPYEIVKLIIMSTYPKIKISCGCEHTCLLMDEIYVWGNNIYGQLGLGHNQKQNSPQKLNLPNIKKIICGGFHTIALTNSNEVWVWGNNIYGQLGLGHNQDQNSPQKLNLPNIKDIICGCYHTTALTNSNEIWVWGDNCYGQLGLGHNQDQNSPQKFAPMQMNRREEGTSERGKLNLSNIKDIICGGRHTIALTDSNEVWVWGYNNEGQLGLGHYQHQNSPQKGGNLRTGETKFAKY